MKSLLINAVQAAKSAKLSNEYLVNAYSFINWFGSVANSNSDTTS